MKILITGGSGFVATHLCNYLLENTNFEVVISTRKKLNISHPRLKVFCTKNIDDDMAKYLEILKETDVLIHTAARTHILKKSIKSQLNDFRVINVDQTLKLANLAQEAKVKRFIFISSVKVHGEISYDGHPFESDFEPKPECEYGLSKLEAELGLLEIAQQSSMETVILRPVLIYGPGMKGNFKNIVKWLKRGLPLPFGAFKNKRSLLGIRNFVDFIHLCIEHPNAKNQVFLVSDGYDISVTDLIDKIKLYLGKNNLNIKISEKVFKIILFLLHKKNLYPKICGSLCVDISKNWNLLGWCPKTSLDEGLKECLDSDYNAPKKPGK